MIFVSCVLIFALIAAVFFKTKNFLHPTILFNGLWLCCLACAGLGLYNMRSFSNRGVIVIMIGLAGFTIGTYIASVIKKNHMHFVLFDGNKPKEISMNISQRLLNVFLVMVYLGIFILLYYVLKNLIHGVPYSYIRNMYYGYGQAKRLIPSTFINTLLNWISVPSLYALIPIAMMNLFEKKGNKKFSILVFIATALYIFGSAGRFMLMFIVIQGLAMLRFYGKKIPKKLKKEVIIALICVFAVLLIITKIRAQGAAGKKVNSIYAYLSIPVYLLDYWLERSSGTHLHGGAFLYGILTFLNYFTSKIGFDIPLYRQAYDTIQITQDKWVCIFPGEWYNAYVSIFYYFYLDFGIIGVILGCMLFGYACYALYYHTYVKKSKTALIYYLLIIQCIVCSIVRWQLGTITMVIAFLMEFIITFNRINLKIPVLKLKRIKIKR